MEKIKIKIYSKPQEIFSKLDSIENDIKNKFEVSDDANIILINDNDLMDSYHNKEYYEKMISEMNKYELVLLFGIIEPFLSYNLLSWFLKNKNLYNNQKFIVLGSNVSLWNVIDDNIDYMSIPSIICHWKPHLETQVNPDYDVKKFIKDNGSEDWGLIAEDLIGTEFEKALIFGKNKEILGINYKMIFVAMISDYLQFCSELFNY